MKNEFDGRRLDVRTFAQQGAEVAGQDSLASHERLAREVHGPTDGLTVGWMARGKVRRAVGGEDEIGLHLRAQARLPLTCQRCMNAVTTEVQSDRWFRFAADETAAAALDGEVEEDVLVLSNEFDLTMLVEDELLMALPMVPLHETCPVEIKLAVADADFEAACADKPSPFAALATLRLEKSS